MVYVPSVARLRRKPLLSYIFRLQSQDRFLMITPRTRATKYVCVREECECLCVWLISVARPNFRQPLLEKGAEGKAATAAPPNDHFVQIKLSINLL